MTCGYSLRSQRTHGHCPECGHANILSFFATHGGRIGFHPDPGMIRRKVLGLHLIGGAALGIAGIWAIMVMGYFLNALRSGRGQDILFGVASMCAVLLVIGMGLAAGCAPNRRSSVWRHVLVMAAWTVTAAYAAAAVLTLRDEQWAVLVMLLTPLVLALPLWDSREWARWLGVPSAGRWCAAALGGVLVCAAAMGGFAAIAGKAYAGEWLHQAILALVALLSAHAALSAVALLQTGAVIRRKLTSSDS